MNIVFLGFQTWGLVSLRAITESGSRVSLAVSHPDEVEEFYFSFTRSIKPFCEERDIPYVPAINLQEEWIAKRIKEAGPDLIVSSNWRTHIPQSILSLAPNGGINVHRSLLPKYGGVAPLNWAIANGEKTTGVTIHKIAPEFDLGDILEQEEIGIGPNETATELFHRTTPIIERILIESIKGISSGTIKPRKQNPHEATFFHKRTPRECAIDWNHSSTTIHNLIRAQSDPFPNAFTLFRGKVLKIKRASIGPHGYRGTPGRLAARTSDGVVIICGAGVDHAIHSITVHEVQEGNDLPRPALEYFKKLGEYLGPPNQECSAFEQMKTLQEQDRAGWVSCSDKTLIGRSE